MECCRIDGCKNRLRYKKEKLCQTHYHRLWRTGSTEDPPEFRGRERYEDDKGYQYVHAPGHPLAAKGQSYVAEQRVVLYEKIGAGEMCCALCGVQMTWKKCQADHIDEDPRNNNPENIRPLCLRCNVWRSMPPAYMRMKHAISLEFNGEIKTAHEWSRDARVSVRGATIIRRKKSGMTDEAALFSEKITHNGKPKAVYQPRYKQLVNRKNAVVIDFEGEIKVLAEWSRDPRVSASTAAIKSRLKNGWSVRDSLFKPAR